MDRKWFDGANKVVAECLNDMMNRIAQYEEDCIRAGEIPNALIKIGTAQRECMRFIQDDSAYVPVGGRWLGYKYLIMQLRDYFEITEPAPIQALPKLELH